MHIIFLSNKNPFCDLSAGANRSLGLLKELSNKGNSIKILISGGYFNQDEYKTYNSKGIIDGIAYEYLSSQKNISIWDRRIREYFTNRIIWYSLRINFKKHLKKIEKDTVVWIGNSLINFKITNVKLKQHYIKYFMELNEYPDIHLHNNSTKYFWQKSIANKQNNYFFKKTLHKLDGLALMTNNLIDYYSKRVSKKTNILYLPMTVALRRFNLDLNYPKLNDLHKPYIAFVGSMNNKKDGVNILIEAFAKIADTYTDLTLCIFGFWTYDSPNHQKRIKDLGLQKRIVYSKPIASDDVTRLIMNAKILVLPRPDSYQAQGGFPTKLGEYLATSNPVISTRVGEIPNYLENNKSIFFCDPGSIDSLTKTLNYVLNNKEKAINVGNAGRKVAETVFSSSIQGNRLNNFLKELIN